MKKLILAFFLFLSLSCSISAPPKVSLLIPRGIVIKIETFNPLIAAVYKYESNCNPLAYNKIENAIGGLQIRQCRLDHYNKLNNTSYKLEDCYNYELSKRIFLYFTEYDGNGNPITTKSWERAAKDWNGSGPATEIYWKNVKNLI